jgi:hypothetical protein
MFNLITQIEFMETNADAIEVNKEFKKMYILIKKCFDQKKFPKS